MTARPWVGECVGSAGLVFAALTAITWTMRPGAGLSDAPLHLRLLVVGFSVGGAVAGFALTPLGRRSGAHLSPAISLFQALRGKLSARDLFAYCGGQLTGSVLGVLAARAVWWHRLDAVHDGAIQPAPGTGTLTVAVVEALSTTLLIWVLAGMSAVPRPLATPLVLGGLITGLIVATGAGTGGSFNPARNFGPQLLDRQLGDFWIYLAAPLVGALVAAVSVRLVGALIAAASVRLVGAGASRSSLGEPGGASLREPAHDPLLIALHGQLTRAGFQLADETGRGGVEIRQGPDHAGWLVSWAPGAAGYEPLDPAITDTEKVMAGSLVRILSSLGFDARPLGESFSVQVDQRARA